MNPLRITRHITRHVTRRISRRISRHVRPGIHPSAGSLANLTALASALLCAFPAAAQSNEELLKELRALKDRVGELEKQLQAARPAAAGQWGMTPEQAQELSRIATKTESLEDTREAMGLKNLKISGYMDPTFIANRRQNTAGFQFLNGVGDDGYAYDNSYFGSVALDFLKETDSGTKYHLTLIPNRGTESVFTGSNRLVQEASVAVPLGDPTTLLIAGHIPDWSGYEYAQPTLNKLITHNLLFDLTLPTAYTGAGLQMLSGKWTLKGLLANMNASKRAAGEKTPVIAYRADYASSEYFGAGFAGVHGKAFNGTVNVVDVLGAAGVAQQQPDSRVDLFEIDTYFIRGDLTLNGQASVGRQRKASITTATGAPSLDPADLRDAQWWGLSGLAAYKLSPRVEVMARADYINNKKNGGGLLTYAAADGRNGIGPDPAGDPNVGANRYALTFGTNYAFDTSTVFKVELRFDRASQPVFENVKDGTFSKSNQLFATSVVVSF